MSVIILLGWLWYAFLGFLSCAAIVWLFYATLRDWWVEHVVYPRSPNRELWLKQHFGDEGARRWKVNAMLVGIRAEYQSASLDFNLKSRWNDERMMKDVRVRLQRVVGEMDRCRKVYGADCFDPPYRTDDGGCRGLVEDMQMLHTRSLSYDRHPPWGEPRFRYTFDHSLVHGNHEFGSWSAGCYGQGHGEPRGSDWLAAGFWDPILRTDDGLRVDPLEVLTNDLFNYWIDFGQPFNGVLGGSEGDALYEKTRKMAKNTRAGIGGRSVA